MSTCEYVRIQRNEMNKNANITMEIFHSHTCLSVSFFAACCLFGRATHLQVLRNKMKFIYKFLCVFVWNDSLIDRPWICAISSKWSTRCTPFLHFSRTRTYNSFEAHVDTIRGRRKKRFLSSDNNHQRNKLVLNTLIHANVCIKLNFPVDFFSHIVERFHQYRAIHWVRVFHK